MGRGSYLGEFEQVVLLAVARLDDEAYGMRVRAEIQAHSHESTPSSSTTYEMRYMTLHPPTNAISSVLSHRTTMPAVRIKR